MTIDFNKLNSMVNMDEYKTKVAEADNNATDFPEIPVGNYIVSIANITVGEAKSSGNPTGYIAFKIEEGEYKGLMLFYNQGLINPVGMSMFKKFLITLDTKTEVEFIEFEQFSNLLVDIFQKTDSLQYELEFGKNKGGYNTFKILNVYDVA